MFARLQTNYFEKGSVFQILSLIVMNMLMKKKSVVLLATAATSALAVIVTAVLVLVKGVAVAISYSVYEVKNLLGVNSYAHETSLKMQVGTGAAARVAAQGDGLASLYILVGLNKET